MSDVDPALVLELTLAVEISKKYFGNCLSSSKVGKVVEAFGVINDIFNVKLRLAVRL